MALPFGSHGTPLLGASSNDFGSITEGIVGLGKAYKSGLKKEDHLGKMIGLAGSGEGRVKRSSSPAGPAGSELPDGIFRDEPTSPANSVYEVVEPSAAISSRRNVSFPGIWTGPPRQYKAGGKAIASQVTMDTTRTHPSESGVPPITSRQHRRSQLRPTPLPSIALLIPPPQQGSPGLRAYALTDPPPHPLSLPQVTPRRGAVDHQHSLSDVHPHLHAAHSPPFAFPHHVGLPIPEENMRHLEYIYPPHAPVYQYRTPPDLVPTSPYLFPPMASVPSSPIYTHTLTNTSPPPNSLSPPRHTVSGPSGSAHHSSPYAMHGAYTSMGYTTHPSYVYPPAPFVPALYTYGPHIPPRHSRPYDFLHGQESQGTGWYPHLSATVAANSSEGTQRESQLSGYSLPGQPEGEHPGQRNGVSLLSKTHPTRRTTAQIRTGRSLNAAKQAATQAPSPTSPTSLRTRHQERRSYHPKLPAYRSEWVMWAGNVPSDVKRDELLKFFNQPLPRPLSPTSTEPAEYGQQHHGGVLTVFIISRSNCAFVNFESREQLEAAMARFNGQSIRPGDQWCPRLVCRVRRREDDLMAGVGGQRGSSMHINWVKKQKASNDSRWIGEADVSTHSNVSRSASIASTNSDILTRFFPQRYFILKSSTQYDLDMSVQKNIWATQHHNEGILDQAYRTSKDVFLIFSANKSGEFYGYARMAGQILRDETSTPWAPAVEFTPPPSSVSSLSDMSAGASPFHDGTDAERQDSLYIFPLDEDRVDQQPQSALGCWPSFALAERHKPAGRLTNSMPNMNTRPTHHSVQASSLPVLISDALSHSLRYPLTRGSRESSSSLDAVSVSRLVGHDADLDDKPNPAPDGSFEGRDTSDDAAGSAWDLSFHIEWIRTDSLPFFRTCHLRNPWNHGREVKVSRDGTELEPKIGQQLLDEWDRRILALGSLPGPSRTPSRPPTRGLRSTKAFPPRLFPT